MLTDTTLTAIAWVAFTVGALAILATIIETLAPTQTAKARMAVRDLLHTHLHVGDPRTRAQRREDDAFMAIVANYHREQ